MLTFDTMIIIFESGVSILWLVCTVVFSHFFPALNPEEQIDRKINICLLCCSDSSDVTVNVNILNVQSSRFGELITLRSGFIWKTISAELSPKTRKSTKSSETCLTVFSTEMVESSEKCTTSTEIGQNTRLFLYGYETLVLIVYGNSGAYYTYDRGFSFQGQW